MITYRTTNSIFDCFRAFQLTEGLDLYYPEIQDWFWNKVVPSTLTGDSSIILAEDNDAIVGVSMVKAGDDPKIRCLRIMPEYENRGIGLHLIDRSLKLLGMDKPMVTVPEEKIHELSRILVNRFSFDLKQVDRGVYRPGKLEYQFNGQANQRIKSPY